MVRAELLTRMTTRELEEDMAAVDVDLLMTLRDLRDERESDRTAYAVNKGIWGGK